MNVTKEYKDSFIRALFNDPQKALKLYSDISGKVFDDNTVIEMKNLDDVVLTKQRNDLAFIINGVLVVLMEHQSTLSLNSPLRMLQYVLLLYEFFFKLGNALYKEKQIKLPKPEFYVLYNGTKPYPPEGEMRLSEAFSELAEGEVPNLELAVKVININYGVHEELMKKNPDLSGYALLVERIRKHQSESKTLKESIRNAVNECLADGILSEFLTKYKTEVNSMFSLMYDETLAREVAREEGWEEGLAEGIEKGIEKGRKEGIEKGREEGVEKGIERGIEKGREEGAVSLAKILLKNGLDPKILSQYNDVFPNLTKLLRE